MPTRSLSAFRVEATRMKLTRRFGFLRDLFPVTQFPRASAATLAGGDGARRGSGASSAAATHKKLMLLHFEGRNLFLVALAFAAP
jgi:hypothetical protein